MNRLLRVTAVEHPFPQRSPEWFALRQQYPLTGSEYAAAIGLDPFTSRSALRAIKNGKPRREDPYRERILMHGAEMEQVAFRRLECLAPPVFDVRPSGIWTSEGALHDKEWKGVAASPDGLLYFRDPPVCWGVIEIKSPWNGLGPLYASLTETPPLIPMHHWVQMQIQMLATNTQRGLYVVCLGPTEPLMCYSVPFHDKAAWFIEQWACEWHRGDDGPMARGVKAYRVEVLTDLAREVLPRAIAWDRL